MDEIRRISYANEAICIWNPLDFMKSAGFQGLKSARFHDEIRRISCMKSARFQGMKSTGFHEIQRISCMKSGGFHGLINTLHI